MINTLRHLSTVGKDRYCQQNIRLKVFANDFQSSQWYTVIVTTSKSTNYIGTYSKSQTSVLAPKQLINVRCKVMLRCIRMSHSTINGVNYTEVVAW